MITRAIKRAFKAKKEKKWEKTFWAIDLHETVLKPNWSLKEIPTDFYPRAKEALQLISSQDDIVLIMYTCSHPPEIAEYLAFFRTQNIYFDYVNENPLVINQRYGNYDKKPYFNVLFEDKAGFDPYEDWEPVIETIMEERPSISIR
ncbi:MAG: hypothetical protein WBA74_11590 [Cyclobacteriaceae bacterium]